MFQSIRYSQLALRLGLAVVFLWFGTHAFIEPQYWLDTWVPAGVQHAAGSLRIAPRDLLNFIGLFDVLVALSLATGFFMRPFAAAAGVFLIAVTATHGLDDVAIRDIGLLSGLVALLLWPRRAFV